jgi:excisionase family DNA binding protein
VTKANTIKAITERAGISRATVYRHIKNGTLKARKLGGRTVILEEDFEALLNSLPPVPFAPVQNAA